MGVECGQSIWRFRSWVPHQYPKKKVKRWKTIFRTFPEGFAVGPLMFFK